MTHRYLILFLCRFFPSSDSNVAAAHGVHLLVFLDRDLVLLTPRSNSLQYLLSNLGREALDQSVLVGNDSSGILDGLLGIVDNRIGGLGGVADQDRLLDVHGNDAREKGQGRDKEREDSHGIGVGWVVLGARE